VDEEGDRLLAQAATVRDESHALDVEIDLGIPDAGAHALFSRAAAA
jgi:hypothetical protein